MGQRKPPLETRIEEWRRQVKRPLTPDAAKRLAKLLHVMLAAEKPPTTAAGSKTRRH